MALCLRHEWLMSSAVFLNCRCPRLAVWHCIDFILIPTIALFASVHREASLTCDAVMKGSAWRWRQVLKNWIVNPYHVWRWYGWMIRKPSATGIAMLWLRTVALGNARRVSRFPQAWVLSRTQRQYWGMMDNDEAEDHYGVVLLRLRLLYLLFLLLLLLVSTVIFLLARGAKVSCTCSHRDSLRPLPISQLTSVVKDAKAKVVPFCHINRLESWWWNHEWKDVGWTTCILLEFRRLLPAHPLHWPSRVRLRAVRWLDARLIVEKMGDFQVTMAFNTRMVIHDLDDLGYPCFRWNPWGTLDVTRSMTALGHHRVESKPGRMHREWPP